VRNKHEFYLYSPRADYGTTPRFIHWDLLPNTGYASLYGVTEEVAVAIEAAGSTKGFKGVVWSPVIQMDFDSYEAAAEADRRLIKMGVEYKGWDTGGRGAHFAITRDNVPSHLLPSQDRAWVDKHFPSADSSIYTHLHPFRLEGTIHEKTGRKKELGTHQSGSSVAIPKIERCASETIPIYSEGQAGSIFDCFRVMANTIPVENGQRHETLIRLLYALKDQAKVNIDVARWWIIEWNKMLLEPKSEEDLEKALRSIYG
jgi:hypothetical protein